MKNYVEKRNRLYIENQWIEDIIEEGGCCLICGYNENPLIIERHHIAGKHNSQITIPVCPTCHRKLTKKQESWDNRWKRKKNPPKISKAFMLRGIADIHQLTSNIIKEYSQESLGDSDNG